MRPLKNYHSCHSRPRQGHSRAGSGGNPGNIW